MSDVNTPALPDDLRQKISDHPFAQALGIEVVSVREGHAILKMKVRPDMANSQGIPHGGAIFSLADTALALASNAYGTVAVALDVSISYCRPAPIGSIVIATATEENLTRRTGLYALTVETEDGKLVASAKGTVFRTGEPIL